MTIKAYVSGALTGIEHNPGIKKFYEDIAAVCAAEGIEAYVPHLLTDPAKKSQVDSSRGLYDGPAAG